MRLVILYTVRVVLIVRHRLPWLIPYRRCHIGVRRGVHHVCRLVNELNTRPEPYIHKDPFWAAGSGPMELIAGKRTREVVVIKCVLCFGSRLGKGRLPIDLSITFDLDHRIGLSSFL